MAAVVKIPFKITRFAMNLTEATVTRVLTSPITMFCGGFALGWFAHKRYGDSLILGISGDAAKLWLELDTDKDGTVSFKVCRLLMVAE